MFSKIFPLIYIYKWITKWARSFFFKEYKIECERIQFLSKRSEHCFETMKTRLWKDDTTQHNHYRMVHSVDWTGVLLLYA